MAFLIGIVLSLAAAVIPAVLYGLAFYLADRYEREPFWLVSMTFLWGAVPAVIASLVGEILIGAPLITAPGSVAEGLVESALVAPLVEEAMKGLALYLIYRFLRNEFDGPLDGLTYGALVGFGFAMTENFFYFIGAFSAGGLVDLTILIVLRAVIFGLNHAFYSGLFGIGLGMARHADSALAARFWAWGAFGAAVTVHALHNFGAGIAVINGIGIVLSFALAVLGAGMVVLALVLSWQQERHWLRVELQEEIGSLLSAEEYAALLRSWRRPVLWRSGIDRRRSQRMHLVVELAFRKHRLRRLGTGREPELPAEIERLRRRILAGLPPVTVGESGDG